MGAVIDMIARWLPADIPVELFVGWAVWLLGGLLLMLWFTRRSDASRVPPVKPVSPSAVTAIQSGTHAVARPASGTHAAARQSSGTHAAARKSTSQTASCGRSGPVFGSKVEHSDSGRLPRTEPAPRLGRRSNPTQIGDEVVVGCDACREDVPAPWHNAGVTLPTRLLLALALLVPAPLAWAQTSPVAAWRAPHEREILDELSQLVAIPNVAGNDDDISANAEHLQRLFKKPRLHGRNDAAARARRSCSPRSTCPSPRGTLTLYIHYDGQPVTASEWTRCKPFAPCVYGADGRSAAVDAGTASIPTGGSTAAPSSDDKGPIVAVLNAVEALKRQRRGTDLEPARRARRRGRSRLAQLPPLRRRRARTRLNGRPRDDARRPAPSERPTDAVLRRARRRRPRPSPCYGARSDLHSGNYGNWAPDPSMRLAQPAREHEGRHRPRRRSRASTTT